MKKFYKWSAITAGIMLAIGMLLAFICAVAGGRKAIITLQNFDGWNEISRAIEMADDFAVNISNGHWHVLWNGESPTELMLNGNRIGAGESVSSIETQSIKNLNLSLGAGTFIIREKETDDGYMDLSVKGFGNCDYQVKNDTLTVEGFKGYTGISNQMADNEIILEIPKGMTFQSVEMEAGAGVMELSNLKAEKLEAVIGAGELKLRDIAAKEFITEIGAGRLDVGGMDVENAEISVSMGECIYQGWIRKDLNAECNMGNIRFELKGSEQEHNYDIECDAGNIDMKDLKMTALAGERTIDNGADSNFDITCNMGNITVEFEEE